MALLCQQSEWAEMNGRALWLAVPKPTGRSSVTSVRRLSDFCETRVCICLETKVVFANAWYTVNLHKVADFHYA